VDWRGSSTTKPIGRGSSGIGWVGLGYLVALIVKSPVLIPSEEILNIVCTLKKYRFPLNFLKAFSGKGLFIYIKLTVCYFRVGGKNLNSKDFYLNYFRVGNVLAANNVVL
jgi:hypothetical protein